MAFARQLKPKRGKIMTTKLLKGALTRIAATAITAVFFTPVASAATSSGDMDNPVTGETKTYDYKYVGSGTWTASDWQDANGAALAAAPGTDNSNLWGSMLVNCSDPISVAQLNGWELQLGVFGGANVTVGELGYWTGSESCFAAVDNASSLTISATTGKNWNNTVKFYVANRSGITFTSAFAPANPNGTGNINYYLKGSGSVTYSDSLGGGVGHVIKQADITLSGTSQIAYKPLVSFTSTTKTFTADAIIKRLNSSGTDLGNDARLTSVTSGYTTTLTTADSVGTCQLVQTSTGIDLYWVDGDPANLPAATVYKPSININFTHGTALTTSADVGLGEYAIPGTSWNNLVGNNGSLSALNAADSSGATWATAASVTISGTRGSWRCNNLTAASDLRQGYIDEEAGNPTPTVTVSGIPFEKYRVVVYTATDTANVKFGYITINGKNYTYVGDALTEGTTSWGASGAKDSAEPIAEGTNVLVSTVMLGSTLTVVGHRSGNDRGCIAAIQIVEYVPEIGENDLKIIVPGDTTYTVNETKELSGTVYVVGSGTLTLNGSAKITAATIDVGPNVTMNVNADRLDGTTFAGSGTVVYDGTVPVTTKGWNDSTAWAGTLWIKNVAIAGLVPAYVANARSTVRLTGVTGYFNNNGTNTFSSDGTLDLQDDGDTKAFSVNNGWSQSGITVFAKLSGSGTLTQSNSQIFQRYVFKDVSAFTGTIDIPAGTDDLGVGNNRPLRVIIGNSETIPDTEKGSITVPSGATATVAGATWKAAGGIQVNGTLTVAGDMTMRSALTVASDCTLNVNPGKKLTLEDAYNLDGIVNVNGTLYSDNADLTQTINGTVNVVGAFDAQGDVVIAPTGNITVSGKFWPNYGVTIKGNLSTPSLANIRSVSYVGNPTIVVDDSGVLTLTSTANNKASFDTSNADYVFEDYSRVSGSGTLKFSSTAGWRTFPSDEARMPATTLTIQTELADSLIITKDNNGETVIGSLAGSKNIRSDWTATSGGASGRTLTVTQSKDTEWEGKFVSNRITQFNVVAPAEGTSGTLTLSGTQTLADVGTPIPLNVSGSVNLTGTWVGATTVAGTIGGTGTLTGNLTFSAGSTFKAFASDENGLSVSGSITYPASGTVTVDVSALGTPAAKKVVLLTAASEDKIDASKFALADGTNPKYKLAKEGATLVLKGARKGVFIGVY